MPHFSLRLVRTPAPFLLLTLSGCELPTSVRIEPGLHFSLNGSGRLDSFSVYGPQPGRRIATPFDTHSLVWSIEASNGYFNGAWVERLDVQYGRVPSRYQQTIPIEGTAPTLSPGRVYYFFAGTTEAPPADGFFYMDGKRPVRINVPGLCQSGFVGEVKPLKCGTQELYSEPHDLEQFVKDHVVREQY